MLKKLPKRDKNGQISLMALCQIIDEKRPWWWWFCRGGQANAYAWITHQCYAFCRMMPFWWKWPFDPCDLCDPGWIFNVITYVEGVKVMHMHKSRVNATQSVGLDAFLVKMTFLTPVTHQDLWPHHCLCMSSGSGISHCDQVWSKSDVGKYVKKTCCQKKEWKKQKRVIRSCGCASRIKKKGNK